MKGSSNVTPSNVHRRYTLLAAAILLGGLGGIGGTRPATATTLIPSTASVCAPPAAATSPGPKCALDIWGQVTDMNGTPFPGALVYDDAQSVHADGNGYYDLYEATPGNRLVTASSPTEPACQTSKSVDVPATVIMTGDGQRQDFRLPCQVASS